MTDIALKTALEAFKKKQLDNDQMAKNAAQFFIDFEDFAEKVLRPLFASVADQMTVGYNHKVDIQFDRDGIRRMGPALVFHFWPAGTPAAVCKPNVDNHWQFSVEADTATGVISASGIPIPSSNRDSSRPNFRLPADADQVEAIRKSLVAYLVAALETPYVGQ